MACQHDDRRLAFQNDADLGPRMHYSPIRVRVVCQSCFKPGPWGRSAVDAVRLWDRRLDEEAKGFRGMAAKHGLTLHEHGDGQARIDALSGYVDGPDQEDET